MAETIPKVEPEGFRAGDTVKWTKRATALGELRDPADSWVLTYVLMSAASEITITGSDNGDGAHLISVTAAISADYPPGVYSYRSYVTKTTERFPISSGSICIEPDFATMGPQDGRSWALRMLAAVESVLIGKASRDQQSYSIAGRSLTRFSPSELMEWRDKLKAEVAAEARAERIAKGLGHPGRILVRF